MERFKSWYIHPQLEQVLLEGKKISILTTEIPKNQYYNNQHCFCPYVINF
jgi:hypothetical protein